MFNCLRGAAFVSCQRHLKQNAQHYAQDVVGMSRTDRNRFIDGVFGDAGLVSACDLAVFDSTVERLRADFMTKLPEQLRAYFDNRLVHLLRDNVAAGCGKWTNNACESINHVLKSTVQWRPSKIPELVTTLRSLVTSQYVDADRALIGRGDFVLRPQFARHRLTLEDWRNMSAAQKQKARDNCFRLPVRSSQVTSTDGTFSVHCASNSGRKPHQRKRPAAERTTTTPKKRR